MTDKEFFMNYAEGQGAPTVKYEDENAAIKEAERLAEKLGVEVTTLKAVTKTAPKDIAKRVKTYEDACAILGIEPLSERSKLFLTKDEIAYRKLKTIAAALNEGWKPDWADDNHQMKYFPWFTCSGTQAIPVCAYMSYSSTNTYTYLSSRLCFKTRELAAYAGKQFIDIYNDFLLIK
jgi:hypothetical protein